MIRGYHADIDLTALNRGVQALIAVQVRPLSRPVIDTFKNAVSKMPEAVAILVVAGGDDFLVHVAVQDLDHLHAFLVDRVSKRREVISFRSSVIYERGWSQVRGGVRGWGSGHRRAGKPGQEEHAGEDSSPNQVGSAPSPTDPGIFTSGPAAARAGSRARTTHASGPLGLEVPYDDHWYLVVDGYEGRITVRVSTTDWP